MKNADDMLKQIMGQVDTSGDGKIQFEGTSTAPAGIRERKKNSC